MAPHFVPDILWDKVMAGKDRDEISEEKSLVQNGYKCICFEARMNTEVL